VRHYHHVVQIDLASLPDDPAVLQQMLQEVVPELQAENEKLWQLIQRLLRHRFGRRSEKLDLEQLHLVLEDAEESAAESDTAKDEAEPSARRRRTEPANRNRGALPAHLPRYEVVIDIDNKQCPCCGGTLHVIGDDRSEMLDLVPAQLRAERTVGQSPIPRSRPASSMASSRSPISPTFRSGSSQGAPRTTNCTSAAVELASAIHNRCCVITATTAYLPASSSRQSVAAVVPPRRLRIFYRNSRLSSTAEF
jgi:hypothetical protein